MDSASIYGKLTSIFREVFDNDELVATPELSAENVLGWDSVNHIRLVISIEKVFNIRFGVGEIDGLKNVGELVDLIQRKTTQRL
jgi:acyl carrier protein